MQPIAPLLRERERESYFTPARPGVGHYSYITLLEYVTLLDLLYIPCGTAYSHPP